MNNLFSFHDFLVCRPFFRKRMPVLVCALIAAASGVAADITPDALVDGNDPAWRETRFGRGFSCSERTCGVALPLPGHIRNSAGTVELWIKMEKDLRPYPHYRTLMSVPDIDGDNQRQSLLSFVFTPENQYGKEGLKIQLRSPDGYNCAAKADGVDWKKGSTHYVAATWGDGGLNLYIDGELKAADRYRGGFRSSGSFLSVGRMLNTSTSSDFCFDELRISSDQRSAAEIARTWKSEKAPQVEADTLALCHFDGSLAVESNPAAQQKAIAGGDFYLPSRFGDGNCNVFYPDEPAAVDAVLVRGTPSDGGKYSVKFIVKDSAKRRFAAGEVAVPVSGDARCVPFRIPLPVTGKIGWYSVELGLCRDGRELASRKTSCVVLPPFQPGRYTLGIDCSFPSIPWKGLSKCGFRFARFHGPWKWPAVEVDKDVYDFTLADKTLEQAREYGVTLMPVLGDVPDWRGAPPDNIDAFAGGKNERAMRYRRDRWRPRDLEEYRQYVRRIAARYRDRIKYWEHYNEPDWHLPQTNGFGYGGTTQQFVDQMRVTGEEIRKADPSAVIVFPGIACGPFADEHFVRDVLALGGLQYFDIAGMHNYGGNNFFQRQVELFRKAGYQGPVWQTERFFEPEAYRRQPLDIVRSIAMGCELYVVHAQEWLILFGNPQPEAFTIPWLYRMIGGRSYTGRIPGKDVYFFGGGPYGLVIAWGDRTTVQTGKRQVKVTDIFGNSKVVQTVGGRITLTPELCYLTPVSGDSFDLARFTTDLSLPRLPENGDFEDAEGDAGLNVLFAKSWRAGAFKDGKAVLDDRIRFAGKYSQRIDGSGNGRFTLIQSLPAGVAGKSWELSCRIRIEGSASLNPAVTVWSGTLGKALVTLSAAGGNGEFQHCAARFDIPAQSTNNTISLGIAAGTGSVWFDDVKLEPVPLPIGDSWNVFLKVEPPAAFDRIPASLKGGDGSAVAPLAAKLENGTLNLASFRGFKGRDVAVLYNEFTAEKDGELAVGVSADWWMEIFLNGKPVFSTMKQGNGVDSYSPDDHVIKLPVKAGKNLLAVKVVAGDEGWRFVCGRPSR